MIFLVLDELVKVALQTCLQVLNFAGDFSEVPLMNFGLVAVCLVIKDVD